MVKPRSKLYKVISELTIYCDFGYTLYFTNKKEYSNGQDPSSRMIIDHVNGLDGRWGRPGRLARTTTDKPSRIISDDCRWEARVTRADQKGPDGELWDLIELSVHGRRG